MVFLHEFLLQPHYLTMSFRILRHTDKMIKKLESAGLGYHVKSEDASEKLGVFSLLIQQSFLNFDFLSYSFPPPYLEVSSSLTEYISGDLQWLTKLLQCVVCFPLHDLPNPLLRTTICAAILLVDMIRFDTGMDYSLRVNIV